VRQLKAARTMCSRERCNLTRGRLTSRIEPNLALSLSLTLGPNATEPAGNLRSIGANATAVIETRIIATCP
jgi:hypothetical protein